ncbi:uncharacterized protein EURHEDRAFT_351269 [Aspergillus ruber CBS 135680]|uniref:Uncharacterized protein n=1 Tax=Aspergillus ruber (strain CBS 135680) TaxID=1388766 RepID=A0A017SHZ0_ASPRC|nr:uncharacterized protein EURHEDRAFT_351269 [Aspergillus ruber CBS 135680]EYE96386.1 hypothetical protein EURHEDRAFT_351269 [Aspergillus ruber CBS 135680]
MGDPDVSSGLFWLEPVSAHTLSVHVGLSASHVPIVCILLPGFWILLLFGEAFAGLVGALLLRSWLLPSCLSAHGTVAIPSLLLLPGPPFRSPLCHCVRVSIESLL